MHKPVPPHGNLKADFRAQDIQQRQLALGHKQPPRHAQTDLEQHAALERAEALAFACGGVDAGQFWREIPGGGGDAAVDERVWGELGAGLLGGALEGEVGEGGRGCFGGEQAVEVLGGGAVDGGYDEVAGEGGVLWVLACTRICS